MMSERVAWVVLLALCMTSRFWSAIYYIEDPDSLPSFVRVQVVCKSLSQNFWRLLIPSQSRRHFLMRTIGPLPR